MSFHVRQKVVCVNAERLGGCGYGTEKIPTNRTIYTVRSTLAHGEHTFIRPHEIKNEQRSYYRQGMGLVNGEPWFISECFRPLIERKTDTGMAMLRKVADDASKRKNLVTTID